MIENIGDEIEFEIGTETGTTDEKGQPSANADGKSDSEQADVIRGSYRIPCEPDTVTVRIEGVSYNVVDIENKGISFFIKQKDKFSIGDEFYPMELIFDGKNVRLKGTLVHVSKFHLGGFLCGIRIADIDEGDRQEYYDFVVSIRMNVLTKS